ncbi:MAG: rhodanese-like domain-containing protein [Rudaea sp.]
MSEFLHRLPEFAANHLLLVMVLVVLLVSLVGNEMSRVFRGYRELTPAALTRLINRDSPLLFDFSANAEFEKAHIPGARNIQMSQFDPETKELVAIKDRPIALYCKTGTTSGQAAARLVKAGFKQVFWLGGGIASWREASLPLAKGR